MVDGLIVAKTVIPYTPMLQLHHQMARRGRTVGGQRRTAEEWAADPAPLVDAYLHTLERFGGYANHEEHFLNLGPDGRPQRGRLPAPGPITNTDSLVSWIAEEGGFDVEEQPELGVDYVEREVSVIRTRNAEFDDPAAPGAAGRALQPDLLLRVRDGVPAIGEIKITQPGRPTKSGQVGQPAADKDPLAALVQALAAVAHLATPSQRERLTRWFDEFDGQDTASPRLDVYLVDFNHGGVPWIEAQLVSVEAIARALVGHPVVSATLRRVVFVELLMDDRALKSKLHWVAG